MIFSQPSRLHITTVYRQVCQFSLDSVRNFLLNLDGLFSWIIIIRASAVYCLVDEVLRHGEILPEKEKNDISINFLRHVKKNKEYFFQNVHLNHVDCDHFPKGVIIFYQEGGPSVCDSWSPIFSGPPLCIHKNILAPPLTSWKNSGPPKVYEYPPYTNNGGGSD